MRYEWARGERRRTDPAMTTAFDTAFSGVVGTSRAISGAIRYAHSVARGEGRDVLVLGEAGTGKALFARAIHYSGARRDRPFVAIDVRGTPSRQLESELFGHEPRALASTFARKRGLLELAEDGTLFIENLGSMPARLQPKLARALDDRQVRRIGGVEEYPVRCRVIASVAGPLEALVADGLFRADLYGCITAVRVSLPPLRDREDDVLLIAQHVLDQISHEQGLLPIRLGEDAAEALRTYHWPGNVRELEIMVKRAAERCQSGILRARHLSIQKREATPLVAHELAQIAVPSTGGFLREIEAEAIRVTLDLAGGNAATAARVLGLSPKALRQKMREHGLDVRLGSEVIAG